MLREFFGPWWNDVFMAGLILAAVIVGLTVQFLILKIIRLISKKSEKQTSNIVIGHLRWPLRIAGPLIFVALLFPFLNLPADYLPAAGRIILTLFIITFAWAAVKTIGIIVAFTEQRLKKTEPESLRSRKIFTQLRIIRRMLAAVIVFLAAAIILLQFDEIRNVGTTILASAGVIGVVLGFAAQRSIATLFAGFQIAISQPIRIDDRVVVENEWGIIEEITLTYVVVRIWDLRRLILPITYFIERPFQNLTRTSADMIGGVYLYVDYTTPVVAVRKKLEEIVSANPLWNGNVCVLQVTDTKENTIVIRALVSAADAPSLWELRCQVREQLVDYLVRTYPQSLPRVRARLEKEDGDRPSEAGKE